MQKQLLAGQQQEMSLKHLLVSEEGSAHTHTHTHTHTLANGGESKGHNVGTEGSARVHTLTHTLMEVNQRDTTWTLGEVEPSV